MKIENWKLEDIKPYPGNAKLHNVEWIEKSLQEFNIDQPIVVDSEGIIIKGHGRLEAAKRLDLKTFPVIVRADLTPEQVKLARIADNRSGEAGWDTELLQQSLQEIDMEQFDFDFAELGINDNWFQELGLDFEVEEPEHENDNDADFIPEEVESICKTGDLWQLGNHKLLCGDCTEKENIEKLMGDEKAELLFTSPPYADMRDYGGCDLSIDKLKKFIPAFYLYAEYQVINLGMKRENHEIVEYWQEYIQEAKKNGYKFLSWNIWSREGMGGSISNMSAMFRIEHEFIFVFGKIHKDLNKTRKNISAGLHTGITNRQKDGTTKKAKQKIVKKYGRMSSIYNCCYGNSKDHPAVFPVELPLEYIKAMTNKNDIVVEPFGGSGTTLIACEKTGRQCRMIEIDEHYCDVIIKRWEEYTGKKAVKIG